MHLLDVIILNGKISFEQEIQSDAEEWTNVKTVFGTAAVGDMLPPAVSRLGHKIQ